MVAKRFTYSALQDKMTGFQNKLKMLLGAICCLLFVFVIVLSLPVYLFRLIVIVLAKLFRPDLGNILNGISSYLVNDYFYNKKAPRANIIVSMYLKGRDWPVQELKETFMKHWIQAKDSKTGKLKLEQFQQYPERWLGFTFYKKCAHKFDINNHVFVHDQENNKNDFVGDEDLNNICEKLLNAHYKPYTSPWEAHLVKNYKSNQLNAVDSNEKTHVLIIKIHHSLADGFSILNAVVEGIFQQNLTNVELPVPRYPKRNIRQILLYFISFPFSFMYEFSYIMSHIFRSSPWKIEDEKKEWYQHCAKSDFIPIEKVKFIKSKMNVSFTSVILYIISSAIDKTLKNRKDKNLLLCKENVNSIFCMSMLPLPGHPRELTNHVTMALFDLPIVNNGTIANGLLKVDRALETNRKSIVPVAVPFYLNLVGCHFYPVGNFIGKQRTHHIGLGNFPSVPFQIEQEDRKWIGVDTLVGALDGVTGSLVQVISYGKYIKMSITAERAVLSKDETTKFLNHMVDEVNHLYDEALLKCNGSVKSKDNSFASYDDSKIESLETSVNK